MIKPQFISVPSSQRKVFACILLCAFCAASFAAEKDGAESYYVVGANGAISIRKAAYEFEDVELRQDTARDNILSGGFALGRRYRIGETFGIQLGGMLNFGSALEDTLAGAQSGQYLVRHNLFHIGIEPELHLRLPANGSVEPFVFAGGGINFTRLSERFYYLDDPRQEVEFTDFTAMNEKRWSPHIHAGAGFDIMPRPDIGFCIRYAFRFWKPVEFEESGVVERNLPLTGVTYREYFLTHMAQVMIVFGVE